MTWHVCQSYSPSPARSWNNPEWHRTGFFQDLCEIPELHQWHSRETYGHNEQQLYMLRIPTESLEDLQPFMDMLNYGKFIQHLDNQWDKQTLHHLICKDNNWLRAGPQQRSLEQMKPTLVSDDRLALYGPNQPTIHSQWLLERVLPQGSFRCRRNESLALLAMHDDHLTKMLQ